MLVNEFFDKFYEHINNCSSVLILWATNIDWDSYWSCMAFFLFLKQIWKSVDFVSCAEIPENYLKLWFDDVPKLSLDISNKYDFVVFFDTSSEDLLWEIYSDNNDFFNNILKFNIDHHISNTMFWDYNYVDPRASSSCNQLYDFFEYISFINNISEDIANFLLLWICYDTSAFRNAWTNKNSMKAWMNLLDIWWDYQLVLNVLYRNLNLDIFKVWSYVLWSIKDYWNWIYGCYLPYSKLLENNLTEETFSSLILKNEILTLLDNYNIIFIISEDKNWYNKVAMRSSNDDYNVMEIAKSMWWWWHVRAAWTKTSLNYNDIIKLVVDFYK